MPAAMCENLGKVTPNLPKKRGKRAETRWAVGQVHIEAGRATGLLTLRLPLWKTAEKGEGGVPITTGLDPTSLTSPECSLLCTCQVAYL
jgi:hypothetical protein